MKFLEKHETKFIKAIENNDLNADIERCIKIRKTLFPTTVIIGITTAIHLFTTRDYEPIIPIAFMLNLFFLVSNQNELKIYLLAQHLKKKSLTNGSN